MDQNYIEKYLPYRRYKYTEPNIMKVVYLSLDIEKAPREVTQLK